MSKKRAAPAAVMAGTGALLLLMQSGYLPGLRQGLRKLREDLSAVLPLLLCCGGTALLAARLLAKTAGKGE